MKIEKLTLQNYRNYTGQVFEFEDGINILLGKNAQGKTNALEAVLYFAIGKSFKNLKDKDLILFGQEKAKISINLQKNYSKSKLEVFLFSKEKKTVKINSLPIKKIGELFTEFNAVYFSPDELRLVKETPEDRRRFMDIDISQTSKVYFYQLGKYDKILASRNKLLKDCKNTEELKNTIDIWNRQLALVASNIIFARLTFLNQLSPVAKDIHNMLTSQKEELTFSYTGETGQNKEEIYQKILSKFASSFESIFW